MKVLLCSTTGQYKNGASKCLTDLALHLSRNNIDVLVTIPRPGDLEEVLKENNIPYKMIREYQCWLIKKNQKNRYIFLKKKLNRFAIRKMTKLIREENIDIVHINAVTSYVGALAAYKARLPVVWHIREFLEEDLEAKFVSRKKAYNLISKSDAIVAISEAVKSKWEKLLSSPIEVVYDGLPVENYYLYDKDYSHNCINFIIYGRICESKGQLFCIQGLYEAAQNTSKNIHCYIAGYVEEQEYFNKIFDFCEENNFKDKVTYLGEISDVRSIMKNMDICCVCSKKEGLGRVTIEALLGGCIVIGANTGATAEILKDVKSGVLYQEGDIESFKNSVINVIDNIDEYRLNIHETQRIIMNKFAIDTQIKKIIKIYNRVLERNEENI